MSDYGLAREGKRASAELKLELKLELEPSAWIGILRASGIDGVFVRQYIESDQDRSLYKAVPMPVDAQLSTCVAQAQFLGEKAFGVVKYGGGFGIRVKSCDFDEILTRIWLRMAGSMQEKL